MLPRFGDPDICPPIRFRAPGASFPPPGPSGRFPGFNGTIRLSDFPPSIRPGSVALVPVVPPVRPPGFALAACGRPLAASQDLWSAGTLTGTFFGGNGGISQVPGATPIVVCRTL